MSRLKKRIITINKLIDDFELDKKELGLSQKTLSNYHYSLKILNQYYDNLSIANYTQEICDEFVSWYHENRPTTNATKNADFRNMNVFHKWLYDKGYTSTNIHIKITTNIMQTMIAFLPFFIIILLITNTYYKQ